MADDRRDKKGRKRQSKGDSQRRASPPRGEMVVSGGKRYEKSMIGDRLESRSARNPRPSTVTAADYADYFGSVRESRKSPAKPRSSRRAVSPRA